MVKQIVNILKVFAKNNLFDEGVELIGSWCFQLYQKHLGAKRFPLRTQDIDFLIPNPFLGRDHRYFIKQLEEIGFNVDFKMDGSLYLWSTDLRIEFLTPNKSRGTSRAIKIKKLGINAIPLRFVNLLLDDPIRIEDSGVKILVPNPVNFCLHKLIIASRRPKKDKSLKDLQQAICTSVIIDKQELLKLFSSLPKKWKATILRMLDKADETLPLLNKEIRSLVFTLRKFNDNVL